MDYERAKELWDKRVKSKNFRRIPRCGDSIKEGPEGSLLVYGWGERTGLLLWPDGRVRIVGGNPGYQSTTMFYSRQLPNYVHVRYVRGYQHGNYVLHHPKSGAVPFVGGLEFDYWGVRNAAALVPLERKPNVRAPVELRTLGRKIKQAWRTQLLTRVRLGVYDKQEGAVKYGALERGDWLGVDVAFLAASFVNRYRWDVQTNYARMDVPLYERVERGFELMWERHKKPIYDAIGSGRLTLDFFL